MKGILIDPFERTVTRVDVPPGIDAIYALIQAQPFTCVGIDDRNAIYVDDEGLYKEDQRFFQFRGYPQPLAGKGLILGSDNEGESVSCTITLADAKSRVTFPAVALAEFVPIPEGTTDNRFGIDMPVIGHTPVFGPDENAVIAAIINNCGTGEHPLATPDNLEFFTLEYIIGCVQKGMPNLTEYATDKASSFIRRAQNADRK